jgi:hypothetical protein
VSSQKVLKSLFRVPGIVIAKTAIASNLMYIFHLLEVLFVVNFGFLRLTHEEGIMSVSGRMSLRLEEGIKVPK